MVHWVTSDFRSIQACVLTTWTLSEGFYVLEVEVTSETPPITPVPMRLVWGAVRPLVDLKGTMVVGTPIVQDGFLSGMVWAPTQAYFFSTAELLALMQVAPVSQRGLVPLLSPES